MQRESDASITLVLAGGLGNQLFQYAAGEYFSKLYGLKLYLECNLGNPRKLSNGLPELFEYSPRVETVMVNTQGVGRMTKFLWNRNLVANLHFSTNAKSLIWNRLASSGFRIFSSQFEHAYFMRDLGFDSVRPKPNSLLSGYFQSYCYWQESSTLKKLRILTIEKRKQEMAHFRELSKIEKPLIVHIRRGDYRNETNFGLLSNNYYYDAIDLLASRVKFGKIWVFSDEIYAANQMLSGRYGKLIRWFDNSSTSSAFELEKMRLGVGYVTANSSFSYWAAALSHNEQVKVVAPKPWFQKIESPKFLIPSEWELVEARWE
jgi:hypothetical protein